MSLASFPCLLSSSLPLPSHASPRFVALLSFDSLCQIVGLSRLSARPRQAWSPSLKHKPKLPAGSLFLRETKLGTVTPHSASVGILWFDFRDRESSPTLDAHALNCGPEHVAYVLSHGDGLDVRSRDPPNSSDMTAARAPQYTPRAVGRDSEEATADSRQPAADSPESGAGS